MEILKRNFSLEKVTCKNFLLTSTKLIVQLNKIMLIFIILNKENTHMLTLYV